MHSLNHNEEARTSDIAHTVKSLENTGKHPNQLNLFQPVQVSKAELTAEALSALRTATGYQGNTLSRVRVSASKPNFEVGSSSQIKLSFGKKTPKPGSFTRPACSLDRTRPELFCIKQFAVFQQRNLLWIPTLSKCGRCQPTTWVMMMW